MSWRGLACRRLAGGGSTPSGGGAPAAAPLAVASFRWEGVEIGHVRTLELPDGTRCEMETLALQPLVFRVDHFLTADECDRIVALARARLKGSLVMGDASKAERTSSSVFLGAAGACALVSTEGAARPRTPFCPSCSEGSLP